MITDHNVRAVKGKLHGNELDAWLALLDVAEPLGDGILRAQMRYRELAKCLGLHPERGKRTVIRTVKSLTGKGWIVNVETSRHYPTTFTLRIPSPGRVLAENQSGILEFLNPEEREKYDLMAKFLRRNKREFEELKAEAYTWLEERRSISPENLADKIDELIIARYLVGVRQSHEWYFDRLYHAPIPERTQYLGEH